jgi:nucleotide-binding universal stress UspA family protein
MSTQSPPVIPGSVVVGVDGSAASDAALEWAIAYATTRHAPLCILHGAGDLGDNRAGICVGQSTPAVTTRPVAASGINHAHEKP